MTLYSAIITLFLVMDPLGNVPVFLSVLAKVDEKKRTWIILRESIIAFIILSLFLFCGQYIMHGMHITTPALSIAGGIILFLIAIRLIFPSHDQASPEKQIGEPLIVPLAIPMIAGPSALATVILFATQSPDKMGHWFIAVFVASLASTLILLCANQLKRLLGEKGLIAIERLMGMILTTIAVQMFLSGLEGYFKHLLHS